MQIINNNRIIQNILEEEENDELLIFSSSKKRKPHDNLFQCRESEGCYEILFNRHLTTNQNKFREYFRINNEQFNFILSLVKEDLTLTPYNRVKKTISAAEKLAVTLR